MNENSKKPLKVNFTLLSILAFVAAPISIFFYTSFTASDFFEVTASFLFLMAFIVSFVLIMASRGQKPGWLIAPLCVLFTYYCFKDWVIMASYFPQNIVLSFLGFATSSMMVVSLVSYLILSVGKVTSRKPYFILMFATLGLILVTGVVEFAFDLDGFTLWAWADQLLFLGGVVLFLLQLLPHAQVAKENRYALKRIETAYRDGILTQEEYQAKKDALLK